MARPVTKFVYQFSELSDRAKETARDAWRNAESGDNWFAESVLSDAVDIAALFGLSIDSRSTRLIGGGTGSQPDIYWSIGGRGDYVTFSGSYSYKRGAAAAVRAHAPQDTALHAIVDGLARLQRPAFYALSATIGHGSGRHLGCTKIAVSVDLDRDYCDPTDSQVDALTDLLRDYAQWIESALLAEFEYRNSDESVDESITINESEFDINGNFAR